MTQPKLRDGVPGILSIRAVEYATDDSVYDIEAEQAFMDGAYWALANLHLLLEPRDVPIINGKRVAIVEAENE